VAISTAIYEDHYAEQFRQEVKNYIDKRLEVPKTVAYPAWMLNQKEAFTIPLRTARDLWAARFGDLWIAEADAGSEEFYRHVLLRLRSAGMLEEITGNFRLKE
jgi:hypothetical protein